MDCKVESCGSAGDISNSLNTTSAAWVMKDAGRMDTNQKVNSEAEEVGKSEIKLNASPSQQPDTLMVESSSAEGVQNGTEVVPEVAAVVEGESGFGPEDPPFFHYLALLGYTRW